MKLILSLSVLVAGLLATSPVLANGKYYNFMLNLREQETTSSGGQSEEMVKDLMDLINMTKNFYNQCKESNEVECKKLLRKILSKELKMIKQGRKTDKDKKESLRKALQDLKRM